MSASLEQIADVVDRLDVLKNVAAKAWPQGVIVGFCWDCKKERQYDWDQVAKMMQKGLPRCKCNGRRIDLK
jgi:hypothetical protein